MGGSRLGRALEAFSKTLYSGLASAGLNFESGSKAKARAFSGWFEKWKPAAEAVASTHSLAKATQGVTFAALQAWLHTDADELNAIREKLGSRRIVVLVDDLDRADPKLVPQLLLAFRELLDLPGFTFILAFDEEIVSAALKDYHSAWTDGTDFLEKILDFRFYLPPVTDLQTHALLQRSLSTFCDFVPLSSAAEIQDLVPRNPRKLKSLVRGLSALKLDIVRHDADELSWIDIWLAQLIKCESQTFFTNILGDGVLEQETGLGYRLLQRTGRESFGSKHDPNSTLKSKLAEWRIDDSTIQARLIELMEAVRARGGLQFRYSAELALRPHRITWREFRQLLSSWRLDKNPSTIALWLSQQAEKQSASVGEVSAELFGTLIEARRRELSEASEVGSVQEHSVNVASAQELLVIIGQFLLDLNYITPARFESIFKQCLGWIGFTRNGSDKDARAVEREFILGIIKSNRLSALAVLEAFKPWNSDTDDFSYEASVRALRQSFRSACVSIVMVAGAQEVLALFFVEGGVRQLREKGRKDGLKYCLFSPESPLWKTAQYDQLLSLLSKASFDTTIYRNCVELADLLDDGKETRLELSTAYFDEIFRNHEFLAELWKAITSRTIQYRMLGEYLKIHRKYVDSGVPAEMLPLTPELESRRKEFTADATDDNK